MGHPKKLSSSRPLTHRLLTFAACGTLALGGFSLPALPLVSASTPVSIGQAEAQSGGGFGGSSRRSPSSSSSSRGGSYGGGYSGGGYNGGYVGGGYGGPIIISNGGGYYGGYGGGFGLGGLIPLIIFGVVIFAVVALMRRNLGGRGTRGVAGMSGSGTAQAVSVQLLLAEGDEVKAAMQRVAQTGDPDSNEGLTRMVQEAALVALRHPERWVYGSVERAQGDSSAVANRVGAWATEARSAFQEQTTNNYQNNDLGSGYNRRTDYSYNKDVGDLYLAVTIAIAAYSLNNLPPAGVTDAAEARAALLAISGVTEGDLIRAEVIWSPDTEGEFLSEDEAIMKYPKLTKL